MARSKQALVRSLSYSAIGALVAAAIGTAQAATLAVGPVEQVNLKASTLVVLGQTYHVGTSALIKNQAGATVPLRSLAPNTLVSVDGAENAAGQTTVRSVTRLPQLDVPGATPLLVTGIVSSESATGQIKVGGLTVDITATLTSDTPKFQVGGLVEIAGTQPNPGGLFLAQNIVSVAGIQGGGSASLGIQGGGASSLGIQGGGSASIKAMGIQGGGHASSLGIQGGGHSASLGIQGGGASSLGIQGGGSASIKAMGIQGGGHASSLGIQGGGHSASLGIQGGGASSLGIQGGGSASIKAMGIQGGGHASSLGIQGGGHSASLGIQGGGASSLGIQGGGKK